mgnify:FL=1|tara:strand:+ start:1516 stop:2262 length:747 start_codon:yes stop_codon:yes gene_type:complete
MAGNYFKNFEFAEYRFGNNTDIDLAQNLTQYVDLIDQIKNNISFTEKYNILSGDRPDVVSFKLYGTMNYYWTFYLMNDHLKLSGWPLNNDEILDQVKSKYPNRVLTTTSEIGALFPVGQVIEGQSSSAIGEIVKRNLDLGQLFVKLTQGTKFTAGETISYVDTSATGSPTRTLSITGETEQYNAVHHYEDNGVQVDIDPFSGPGVSLTPITYRDRLESRNDALKEIVVIRPNNIVSIASQFQKFIKLK